MNINCLVPKIDDIDHIAKQSNASIIGISKSKLYSSILNNELDIEDKCFRAEDGVAYCIRKSLSYTYKPNFCGDTKNIFIDIFFPKSMPILAALLHWPRSKPEFIEHLDNSLALFRMDIFEAAHGWGAKKDIPSLKSVIYILQ